MKIIDIHTHYFPDSMASNTVKQLEEMSGVKGFGDGSLASLRQYMKEDGITIAINAPVATKPEQVISINRKMIEHNSKAENRDIICFGSMHPYFSRVGNISEEIEFLVKNNIKGIKLHTEYQKFYPDDGRMKKIYEECAKNNIIILFHAGVDLAYDADDVNGTPKRFAEVAKVKGLKLILAHMGGYRLWDEVYRFIAGSGVYLDTAYTAEMEPKVIKGIIDKHGTDKILFGSDFPWQRSIQIREKLKQCYPDTETLENILYKNGAKLLGLDGF